MEVAKMREKKPQIALIPNRARDGATVDAKVVGGWISSKLSDLGNQGFLNHRPQPFGIFGLNTPDSCSLMNIYASWAVSAILRASSALSPIIVSVHGLDGAEEPDN